MAAKQQRSKAGAKPASRRTKKAAAKDSSSASPAPRRGRLARGIRLVFSHALVAAVAVAAVYIYGHRETLARHSDANEQTNSESAKPVSNFTGWSAGKGSPTHGADPAAPSGSQPPPLPEAIRSGPPTPAAQDGLAAAKPAKSDMATQWRAARTAFWANDPKVAESYKQLIARFPSNPALHGELGNILFAAGKNDQAAARFYQAGRLFVERSRRGQAAQLAAVLDQLAPAKAHELRALIAKPN